MKELIVATTNQGKVKEIQAMLKDLNIEVKSLKDVYDDVPDIVEDAILEVNSKYYAGTYRVKELTRSANGLEEFSVYAILEVIDGKS